MALSVSRPVRIFALVAVVAMFGGMAMLTLHKKPDAVAPVISHTATPKAHVTAKTKAPVRTKTATKAKPAAPVAKVPKSAIAANGLPMTVEDALHAHRIVVVSVFDPQSSTDAIGYAEARAGAAEAGAGFVGVSLLDSTAAGALTTLLPGGGLLPSPGVLIYRRPGTLVQLLNGFNDRDAVAQAAAASTTAAALTSTQGS